jgi:hypothetical protein
MCQKRPSEVPWAVKHRQEDTLFNILRHPRHLLKPFLFARAPWLGITDQTTMKNEVKNLNWSAFLVLIILVICDLLSTIVSLSNWDRIFFRMNPNLKIQIQILLDKCLVFLDPSCTTRENVSRWEYFFCFLNT